MKVKENTKPERIYTMSKSKAELETAIRNDILSKIAEMLSVQMGTDVRPVSASELMIPVLDEEKNEKYAVIKVTIPRGTRNGSGYDPYNGYEAADAYKADLEEKAAKKAASAAKKEQAAKLREAKREARQVKKAVENLEKAVQDYNEKKGE